MAFFTTLTESPAEMSSTVAEGDLASYTGDAAPDGHPSAAQLINFFQLLPGSHPRFIVRKFIKNYFRNNINPVLSPQIVDANHPFPHLVNKEIYVILLLL